MKQRIQIGLAIVLAITAIRTGYILYQRHEANKTPPPKQETALPADYYVVPRRLHAYDLTSAKQLKDQPAWVRDGYRSTYYVYDTSTHRVNFSHDAGLLLPLEKLKIVTVILDAPPTTHGPKQVMAVFEKDGKQFAFPIGTENGGDYQIYADDMLFIQDPRELYKHWSADVWDAIDKHEVRPGMNELQADFAVGMGVPDGESSPKTVRYDNGGRPLTVVFRDGKATDVKDGK